MAEKDENHNKIVKDLQESNKNSLKLQTTKFNDLISNIQAKNQNDLDNLKQQSAQIDAKYMKDLNELE